MKFENQFQDLVGKVVVFSTVNLFMIKCSIRRID